MVKSVCESMLSNPAIVIFLECNSKIGHECVYCIGILECVSVHRHMHVIWNSPFIFVSILAATRRPSLSPPTSMFFQVSIVKDPLCSLLYLYGLFRCCIVCFTMHYTCMVCFTIIRVWFGTLFHGYACMVCFTVIPVWFVVQTKLLPDTEPWWIRLQQM